MQCLLVGRSSARKGKQKRSLRGRLRSDSSKSVSFSSLKSGQAVQARSQETVKIFGFAVDICYDGVIKNVEWSEVKNQGFPPHHDVVLESDEYIEIGMRSKASNYINGQVPR